ncbi:GNAT family N-acetyltransferase [Paenibacillus sp. UNC451MF]|uniref:GNAT family N-acetyltransferase n=1 Tax=Paenibacillus sp. UNC451MF TaxID=1449063 RepID=UPI00048EF858|nr:GNAT family N-acetyltransferase [Paenibacillus sp. UNC451MF]
MELWVKNISEDELEDFVSILREAALWIKIGGVEMWSEGQFTVENMLRKHSLQEMYMGYINQEAAATMILQEEDTVLWPDLEKNDSLFLHKLAVRRKYAKQGLAEEMVNWAKTQAKSLGKAYVRLDCAADRPKLCHFYENQGFKKVSERVMFGKYKTAFYEFCTNELIQL